MTILERRGALREAKKWVDRENPIIPDLTLEQMKEDILWYVQEYDWVTLVELAHRYGNQGQGDHALTLEPNLNVVLWTGLSEKLVTGIIELTHKKEIHSHPGSFLAYMVDGGGLKLPLAKRAPRGGYKKPHWLPVTLRSGPFCGLKNCPGRVKPVMVKQ